MFSGVQKKKKKKKRIIHVPWCTDSTEELSMFRGVQIPQKNYPCSVVYRKKGEKKNSTTDCVALKFRKCVVKTTDAVLI